MREGAGDFAVVGTRAVDYYVVAAIGGSAAQAAEYFDHIAHVGDIGHVEHGDRAVGKDGGGKNGQHGIFSRLDAHTPFEAAASAYLVLIHNDPINVKILNSPNAKAFRLP